MEYHPRIVSWNITGACHLGCPHCYLDARRPWPGELTTEEGRRLIDQMAEAGTELLILTGGEPLLRRDLLALARHAAQKGVHVVLGTTGMLITLEMARRLRESGVAAAGISIDSLDPAKHDAFRGVRGAWQGTVRGIEACREAGLDVVVHTTALKMNQREISDIVRFASEKGARAFHLFFLVCTGRGEGLTDLSPQEYEALLSFVLDAQQQYPGMMVRARCAPYIGRLALERGLPPLGSAGCLAGTTYCRITPTGDVTPCPYLPTPAGNVREAPFGQIWHSSLLLACLRNPQLQLEGKCGQCPHSRGDEPLCVGCRARSYALTGSLTAEDPWCLYQVEQKTHRSIGEAARTPGTKLAQEGEEPITWAEEALARLGHVPFFIRGRVKQSAEAYVRQHGLTEVTLEVLEHLRQRAYGGRPPAEKEQASPPPEA